MLILFVIDMYVEFGIWVALVFVVQFYVCCYVLLCTL